MKKIILLFFTGVILQSCNGQKKQTEKFDLDSVNFTENVNSILKKLGFNISNMNPKKYNPPLINSKDLDSKEDSDIWMLINYHVVTLIVPENVCLKDFSLSGVQLSFDYNDKNQKIGMYILSITDEKKGEELISFLEKNLGIPKKTELISSQISRFPLVTDYKRNISQTGYVWKNIDGKTYCLSKFYDSNNKTYLGHHLAVIKSDDEYFIEVLSGEWDVISDILTED